MKEDHKLSLKDCYQFILENLFSVKKDQTEKIGLEMEMFPMFKKVQGVNQVFTPVNSLHLKKIIEPFIQECGLKPDHKDLESISKYTKDGYNIFSFEPGGQFEYSSPPSKDIDLLTSQCTRIQNKLEKYLRSQNIHLIYSGINPWHSSEDIGLQMTKDRYQCMNNFYNKKDNFGKQMMRQTCTIQVCLDYSKDKTEAAKRYLGACLISPFASAIFANSPFMENKRTPYKSYRVYLWNKLDPSRTGFPSLNTLSSDLSLEVFAESYLQFLLGSEVIYIENKGKTIEPKESLSFEKWLSQGYEGIFPNLKDLERCLTLLFPEVRPRNFLELRSVDMQARPWQFVPLVFYTGLLYDSQNLDYIHTHYKVSDEQLSFLRFEAAKGLFNELIKKSSQDLMLKALEGYKRVTKYMGGSSLLPVAERFYDLFTAKGLVPADEIISTYTKKNTLAYEKNLSL